MLCFFSEPSFPYLDALAPFQPLQMRAVNCPIDTSLNFSQAKKLVRDLKPGFIAVPKQYTAPPVSASQRTDLQLDLELPIYSFNRDESVKLPVSSKFERITLDPELAEKLKPAEIKPGVSMATVSGTLKVLNNQYKLFPRHNHDSASSDFFDKDSRKSSSRNRKETSPNTITTTQKEKFPECHMYGKLNISELLQNLASSGISTDKVEEPSPGSCIIHLVIYNSYF